MINSPTHLSPLYFVRNSIVCTRSVIRSRIQTSVQIVTSKRDTLEFVLYALGKRLAINGGCYEMIVYFLTNRYLSNTIRLSKIQGWYRRYYRWVKIGMLSWKMVAATLDEPGSGLTM